MFILYVSIPQLLNNRANLLILYSFSVENFILFFSSDILLLIKYPISSYLTFSLFDSFSDLLISSFNSVEKDIFPPIIKLVLLLFYHFHINLFYNMYFYNFVHLQLF